MHRRCEASRIGAALDRKTERDSRFSSPGPQVTTSSASIDSRLASADASPHCSCARCIEDREFVHRVDRPQYEALRPAIRLVDLFSGCGGLSLGIAEAAWRVGCGTDIPLAIDHDKDAVSVYRTNFPNADVLQGPVETYFDGKLRARRTAGERRLAEQLKSIDILVGGPPCQGYSDLNNHTRRDDPRNALYARMARAAWLLEPWMVLIENVPTVRHDIEKVVEITARALESAGYAVADRVIDLSRLGTPQRRRRHVILALRDVALDPARILDSLPSRCEFQRVRTVHWAIGDLVDLEGKDPYDTASVPTSTNRARMDWLFDHGTYDLDNSKRPLCHQSDHTYRSMYGRLRWDQPAQTVTTGFGSMGQGRYVHPSKRRTITPHEAARLQSLPDFFRFDSARSRGAIARMIGNSVPPMLGIVIGERVLKEIVPLVEPPQLIE